jgi:NTE family protein
MNAVVLTHGLLSGGRDGARAALARFWQAVSEAGARYSPVRVTPWDRLKGDHWNNDDSFSFQAFKAMTNAFSPYQLNPTNFNPLRDILVEQVDFAAINRHAQHKLFLSATNVQTGNVRVFQNPEISVDVVMASACLPFLYQAVEIDGHTYWDGGYMGNPALFPLFYLTEARDVLIVHINPIVRAGTPTSPHDIDDRVNEISFNSALIKELRAVAFVQKLIGDGWLKDEFRDQLKFVLIHSLRADDALSDLSAASKLCTDWNFLETLRDRGRDAAGVWLERHFDDVGKRQTVDLRAQFLDSGSEMRPLKAAIPPGANTGPAAKVRAASVAKPPRTRKSPPKRP